MLLLLSLSIGPHVILAQVAAPAGCFQKVKADRAMEEKEDLKL